MDINELRAEVARRQQAAQRKVARLRRAGVNIAGTEYDVRRDRGRVSRYNTKQLSSYLSQLNTFVDRRNAFVGGVEGAPLPRADWRAYQKAEKAYKNAVDRHYENVKNVFIEQSGVTVGEFDKRMRRERGRGTGGVPRPLEDLPSMEPFQITSAKRLRELTRRTSEKADGSFVPAQLKKQKFLLLQAVAAYGDQALSKQAKELTDYQLDVMWNYTDAPRDLFGGYQYMTLLSNNKADETQASIYEDASFEARQWLNWASKLTPPEK